MPDVSTGNTVLDEALQGGFPKGSVILLAGSSGSGKTIFSHQWLFSGAEINEPGIYITLTEPLFKTLQHLEPLGFYKREFIEEEKIRIIDLREIYPPEGFDGEKVLRFIEQEVKTHHAKRLCIDSITAIAYHLAEPAKIRHFIFELGKILATLGCTTLLLGEIHEEGKYSRYDVEEFISDAILRLDQRYARGFSERFMHVVKMRGKQYLSEPMKFTITTQGLVFTIFPTATSGSFASTQKLSTGIAQLDSMLRGGIFKGSSTLLSGASGTGKSTFTLMYLSDGLKKGEHCVLLSFEESEAQILRNALGYGIDLQPYIDKNLLQIYYLDVEAQDFNLRLSQVLRLLTANSISRCVIDSLSVLAHISPTLAKDLHRLNESLKKNGTTVIYTLVLNTLSEHTPSIDLSSLVDNVIFLRYVELNGELKTILNIVKTRGSSHSKELRMYSISETGVHIGQSLVGYEGIVTGVGKKVSKTFMEELEQIFCHYIGPMGKSVLKDILHEGISKEKVIDYLKDFSKQGILNAKQSQEFISQVESLFQEVKA